MLDTPLGTVLPQSGSASDHPTKRNNGPPGRPAFTALAPGWDNSFG
jgi:hypothetical protein